MTVHQMCEAAARERCNCQLEGRRCQAKPGQPCSGNRYHLTRFAQAAGHGEISPDDFVSLIPSNDIFFCSTLVTDPELLPS